MTCPVGLRAKPDPVDHNPNSRDDAMMGAATEEGRTRPAMPSYPRLLLLAVTMVPVLLLLPDCAQARGTIYRYIDSDGVVHFSNVPADDRYHPLSRRPPGLANSPQRRPKAPINHGYDELIVKTARRFDLEPALVKAVIAAESNFSRKAKSRAGAQGLMQLMPRTADELGVADPYEADENVRGGAQYLAEMLERYGDLRRALAAYNAGPKAVDHYRGVPPYRETEAYVKRVLSYYRGYRNDFHH